MLSTSPFFSAGRPGAMTIGLFAVDSTAAGIGPRVEGVVDGPRPRLASTGALRIPPKLVPAKVELFTLWVLMTSIHAIPNALLCTARLQCPLLHAF